MDAAGGFEKAALPAVHDKLSAIQMQSRNVE
jgi:hypothetical protein